LSKLAAPPDVPAPPARRLKQPSWLDGRLVVGVVLVLCSVVLGAKIVASSQSYDDVWAAARDLAPGTTIGKGDLTVVKVRFHDHGGGYYSATGGSLVGRTTVLPLAAGELIPTAAVPAVPAADDRLVTVPVAKLHMPRGGDLRGTQVDVYVTPKADVGGVPASPRLVLANVVVADTIADSSLGGGSGSGVVLEVPQQYVAAVVGAVESGAIDVVRVPAAAVAASASPGPATDADSSATAGAPPSTTIPSAAAAPSP
jgi:hypothetical protein